MRIASSKKQTKSSSDNEMSRFDHLHLLVLVYVFVDIKLWRVVVLYVTVKYMRCVHRVYVTVNDHE